MNTKTMRLPPRRVLTPTKRKERDDFDARKPSTTKSLRPTTFQAGSDKAAAESNSSNQLLAGYLSYEYLTKGTLFGQPFDRAVESRRIGSEKEEEGEPPSEGIEPCEDAKYQRYVEVARLLKADGAHLPGIVNPTQLGRFLHVIGVSK